MLRFLSNYAFQAIFEQSKKRATILVPQSKQKEQKTKTKNKKQKSYLRNINPKLNAKC